MFLPANPVKYRIINNIMASIIMTATTTTPKVDIFNFEISANILLCSENKIE
jgi:hypothetical protein